jgi:tRNA A37 threonylcarbamoyladenosine synthetase subunit TsaC/SUA5/YrdC
LTGLPGLPVTTTSVNINGQLTPYDIAEIRAQYGMGMESIALVLDQGRIEPLELSTIVDITTEQPRMLKQGRIDWQEIQRVLYLT